MNYFMIGFSVILIACMLIITRFQVHSNIEEDSKIYGKLTTSGWILITSVDDQICKRQIEILGYMRTIIPIWDILQDRDKIIRIGARDMESVPCWFNVFTKDYKYGVLSLKKVKRLLLRKRK